MIRNYAIVCCAVVLFQMSLAVADEGSLAYRASVVHNNRSYMSVVNGVIDLSSGDFLEEVEQSYFLNWKQVPAGFSATGAALPVVAQVDDNIAHHFESGLPSFDSPLLRHFVISKIISGAVSITKGDSFLDGQLVIIDTQDDQANFEHICSFMGSPLVIVGRRTQNEGRWLVRDLAVLGASEEMYQYIMDEITWTPGAPGKTPFLPTFESSDYVSFPKTGSQAVPIRSVKDWLVFQGSLPNGRPLNLVLDSGSETSIIDDMVLELDSWLEPDGEMLVAGAFQTETMEIYQGFSFNVGGVEFHNLPVAGTALTSLAYGADLRIHGVVGSDILRLCRLDLDLENGTLILLPPSTPESASTEEGGTPESITLPLTFIHDLPHIPADVLGSDNSLLLLDTGQRSSLQVNIDLLETHELDDALVMNGFLGGIAGGLQPRYMLENLNVAIAGESFEEREVDALMANSYTFRGQPVIGTAGFAMLSGHYSSVSIDYQNRQMILRGAQQTREFIGQPDAWIDPVVPTESFFALSSGEDADSDLPLNIRPKELPDTNRPSRLEDGATTTQQDFEEMFERLSGASPDDLRAAAPGMTSMIENPGGNPGESKHLTRLLESIDNSREIDTDKESGVSADPILPGSTNVGGNTPGGSSLQSDVAVVLAIKLAQKFGFRASSVLRDSSQKINEGQPGKDEDPFAHTRNFPKLRFSPLTGPKSDDG